MNVELHWNTSEEVIMSTGGKLVRKEDDRRVIGSCHGDKGWDIHKQSKVPISALTDYFTKGKGIILDKPIAAFTIYKCLLRWKCFDAEKHPVFNLLICKIDKEIKKEDDNDYMVYWFSNTLILLYYIRESVKHYDSILFKQQLISLVESLYHIFCGYFKEKMESLLTLSIVAPTISKFSDEEEEDSQYVYESSDNEDSEYTYKMSDDGDSQSNDWKGIVDLLNTILNTLKENFTLGSIRRNTSHTFTFQVPPVIVQEIFGQLFSLINAHLFNRFLLYPEYCTYINAIYFRDGLDTLEKWCLQTTEEYARGTMGKLQHLREVVALLCLSQRQLDGICTFYREEDGSRGAAIQVISQIKYLMIQNSNREGRASFYLTNNSSKPILVNDILNIEGFLGAKLEAELAKYPPVNFIND
ncbi:myosin 2 [Artemisia annua]|uniref:Myosin 2 n=1 Tax=Artemisia annua TaxID=35608 RepID=A0A2U1NNC1_ARTAN|nr:myosin 2 [Artemisia annua]